MPQVFQCCCVLLSPQDARSTFDSLLHHQIIVSYVLHPWLIRLAIPHELNRLTWVVFILISREIVGGDAAALVWREYEAHRKYALPRLSYECPCHRIDYDSTPLSRPYLMPFWDYWCAVRLWVVCTFGLTAYRADVPLYVEI